MAERGIGGVAINEITEAADVGFGSFYNHFDSKEAIYSAVTNAMFEAFGDALDSLVRNVEDPAQIVAICVRHTVRRAAEEPLWGRFLVREGLAGHGLTHGLGARLTRDVQNGIEKGRFSAPDPLMSIIAVGAGVLGAIAIAPQGEANLPERAAAVLLHNLGLDYPEAQHIAGLALPRVD